MYNEIIKTIKSQAKGIYQEKLLNGLEPWGRSPNPNYRGSSYRASKKNLLKRINHAIGLNWVASTELVKCEVKPGMCRWKKVLVIWQRSFGGPYPFIYSGQIKNTFTVHVKNQSNILNRRV